MVSTLAFERPARFDERIPSLTIGSRVERSTQTSSSQLSRSQSSLAQHDGAVLVSSSEAVLKGALESEVAIGLIVGPRREPFASLFRIASDEQVVRLLQAHEMDIHAVPSAARGIALAAWAARAGRSAIALVPHDQIAALARTIGESFRNPIDREASLTLIIEDRPEESPEACPIRFAQQLGFPCLYPSDCASLRSAIEHAQRLSQAARMPAIIIVHQNVLHSAVMIDAQPNRVLDSVDAILARRRLRRRPRASEASDVLRLLRRLELNESSSLPSPGERVPVGFIVIGPTACALQHLEHVLRLRGRVPMLQLAAVHPIDDAAVERLLSRCEQAIVLEPRPGSVESDIIRIAEAMRHRGDQPASVWGRTIPAETVGENRTLTARDTVHPSLLARRIVHLLHLIRPASQVASQLVPQPRTIALEPPPRDARVGMAAVLAELRRMAGDLDQWLRERRTESGAEDTPPPLRSVLSIEGSESRESADRVVKLEFIPGARFLHEGASAIRQVARTNAPSIFLIIDIGLEDQIDLERFARAVIPAEQADRVRIEHGNLSDRIRFTELLREAALAERMTVFIVRDGPPAQYDIVAIERAMSEVDRLGFEPRQQALWPVDRACAVRQPPETETVEQRAEHEYPAMRSEWRVEPVRSGRRARPRVRIRPMWEQVHVIRTRPPLRRWRRELPSRIAPPEIRHRTAPVWRVHLAGFRGDAPGVIGRILMSTGRNMGFAIGVAFDPTPIGPGRRAWTELLFTRPREDEPPPPIVARTPFGEADLLLGFDLAETIRSISTDRVLRVASPLRTSIVANNGAFADDSDPDRFLELSGELTGLLNEGCCAQPQLVQDFAGICRAWFHTDRLADVAVLGAAYQLGLIPATSDAIESAVAEVEESGFGRLREAFQFGRRVAGDERWFGRPRDDRADEFSHLVRRTAHLLNRPQRFRRRRTPLMADRLTHDLLEMPGLAETDTGREARRDFVMALYRCYLWGGRAYAEQFARLITDLYHVDRGDRGRALTRAAVLPLATMMLIRDPIYIATVATSAEQARRIRQRLNARQAREDEIRRRFLTRIEVTAFGRHFRADIRTSDWPARLSAALRHIVPLRWRGTKRERQMRQYLIEIVQRAASEASHDYERHHAVLHRLNQQAIEDRLRDMALAELRMLADT